MPPTIYDSSLLTQRNRTKAVSGSFLNRIASNNTSYAPALGIWDQSIVNSVKNGQMKYFRKGSPIDNGCPCVSVAPVICPSITLSNIATFDGDYWHLNNDVTILECQTLEISSEFVLAKNMYKFINYGSIIINSNSDINETINYGSIINNSSLSISGYNCINNGSIINNNGLYINGTITNNGTIKNDSTLLIFETLINNGIVTNNGTLKNTGTITNNNIFTNNGTIYNYNNGTVTNNGTYTENDTLNNADGTSTCGTGTLNGTIPLTATGNVCPP